MKRKTTEPTTFHGRLLEAENRRHASRIKEIQAAEGKLRMFEPIAVELEKRGIRLSMDSGSSFYSKSLRISTGIFEESNRKLYDALIELGFKEVHRSTNAAFTVVDLKQSRLVVSVDVPVGYGAVPAAKTMLVDGHEIQLGAV